MADSTRPIDSLETDPRFPSGPWTGYFLQPVLPGRHMMELGLTFHDGSMVGQGRDRVGPFVIEGSYDLTDGKCRWIKTYLGKHQVHYSGYNEGKGIWGTWDMPAEPSYWRGGFHIWPEGMANPSEPQLYEEADLPVNEELEPVAPLYFSSTFPS